VNVVFKYMPLVDKDPDCTSTTENYKVANSHHFITAFLLRIVKVG